MQAVSLLQNFISANALLVTCISACAGGLSWLFTESMDVKKPTLIGLASGVIFGLVAITPAAGYVGPSSSVVIGILGGIIGYFGTVKLKVIIGYDDSLDAFGVHGLVGIAGALMTGIFANPLINDELSYVWKSITISYSVKSSWSNNSILIDRYVYNI